MFENPLPHHTVNEVGTFSCPAVAKNNVHVVTLSRGVKACGHCIAPLHDVDGNKIPYTMAELLDKR